MLGRPECLESRFRRYLLATEGRERDIEWWVVLWVGILSLVLVPGPPAFVTLNLHEVLMLVCVDEELRHFAYRGSQLSESVRSRR